MLKKIKKMIDEFKPVETGIEYIDKRYDPNSPYYRFFYQLAKEMQPQVIVELGTWQGTSAAHFAAGTKGTVITVDHHSDPGDLKNKVFTQDACLHFENLRYCQGWTCNELYQEEKDKHLEYGENAFPKVTKELNGRKIDVLFIDSWHRYDQAMKDWNAYKPLLNKGALVICDDIVKGSKGSGIEDMDKFWNDMKCDKFLTDKLHAGYPMGFFIYD